MDENPRILILMMSNAVGGGERHVINLVNAFVARRWRVQGLFSALPVNAAFDAWIQANGGPLRTHDAIYQHDANRTWSNIWAFRRLLRAYRPDILNLHYGWCFIPIRDIIAIRLSGCPRLIVTVHHVMNWEEGFARKRRMTLLSSFLISTIIVVSRATCEDLVRIGVPRRKITIIPPAVTPPRASPPRDYARQHLDIPADAFVITGVARLVRTKGIDHLIKAAALVRDPERKLIVMICGDGPERSHLEELASAHLPGQVRFLGRISDAELEAVYAASDVFALPSREEGFGIVYVEAAFRGVPSIGPRSGGALDAIVDEETGILVPPEDLQAIADAITRLKDTPALRERLGAAARTRAYASFTSDRIQERYAKIFKA